MIEGKRGISPIIATVMILVLTFVAITIVAVFVVPFVKNNLAGSQDCLEVIGKVKFAESDYNCYVNTGENTGRTGFSVRLDDEKIIGYQVSLFNKGSSYTGLIKEDTIGKDLLGEGKSVKMLLGTEYVLDIPQRGGVRTYVANSTFDKVEISPILENDKICEVSDVIQPVPCIDQNIKDDLLV